LEFFRDVGQRHRLGLFAVRRIDFRHVGLFSDVGIVRHVGLFSDVGIEYF